MKKAVTFSSSLPHEDLVDMGEPIMEEKVPFAPPLPRIVIQNTITENFGKEFERLFSLKIPNSKCQCDKPFEWAPEPRVCLSCYNLRVRAILLLKKRVSGRLTALGKSQNLKDAEFKFLMQAFNFSFPFDNITEIREYARRYYTFSQTRDQKKIWINSLSLMCAFNLNNFLHDNYGQVY